MAGEPSELGSLAVLLRKIAATARQDIVLAPGTVIDGRYTVAQLIGRGGMGVVYAVRDADLDEVVALKMLHHDLSHDEEYRRRLRAEVRLARRVSHPNVCRVHDIGLDRDQLFVTMELVGGRSLRRLLRETGSLPAPEIVEIVGQIASALSAAHRAGVLHRDIKPDNVIVEDGRVVLTDFGVASLAADREQVVAGTPAYIAPEVLRGEPFDHRADVYSLAVLAYELATGAPPFPARTLAEAIAHAKQRTAIAPCDHDQLRVIAAGLAVDPSQRTDSAEQFASELASVTRTGLTPRRGSQVQVATALVYRSDDLGASTAGELERIIVDTGGMAIATSALEATALFGVPVALGDDAERAVRAAQALIGRRRGRAGLDTVRVVFEPGSTSLASQGVFDAAARLAGAAGSGEILVATVTARQLAARFDVTSVETGSGSAQRIAGARPATHHAEAATFRARELATLLAIAQDCFATRSPRHVEIRAPAGFGKTGLRDAVIARLREREIDWLIGRTELYGGSGPFSLLQTAHREWYAAIESAKSTERIAAARRWLELRAVRTPVAFVVDDLQWADERSRAFVDELVASVDDVPLLILTFVRTSDGEPAPASRPGVDVIALGPIDDATATTIVRELAPGAPAVAVEELVARAGGHPLFLEELARELAQGAQTAVLPATIEAIIQARLARLGVAHRDVLGAAAVIGPTFWRDLLVDLVGETELDAKLAELERLSFIAPLPASATGERYRFVHTLVRDVALARLTARERRATHAIVATTLARRYPALATLARADHLPTEIVTALAHHLEHAGETARAATAYRIAGKRCLDAALYREATVSLQRAASLASVVDAQLGIDLGDAMLHAGTIADAEQWYERARAATPDEAVPERALIWHKLGNAASRRADHARAMHCFEAGLALAAPDGNLAGWAIRDPRTAALLYGSLGWLAGYLMDDNERGLAACKRAVALLDGTPHRSELAHALSRLGATYMRASRFADQLACNQRNLEIALEIGDVTMQTTARINLGVVYGVVGDIAQAIKHTEIARELATRSGHRHAIGLIESNLAGLYLECDRLDDAQRCLDDALVLCERVGRKMGLAETYGFAARLRAARGDLAGARQWAAQALALADDLDTKLDQSIALRLLAQIHARAGDAAAARHAIAEAVTRGAGLDRYEAARTEAARARVLRRLGDETNAEVANAIARAELAALGTRRELEVLDSLDEVR